MNSSWYKANVKRFGFNKLHQDFGIMRIIHIAMDACRDNRSKENVYTWKSNIGTIKSLILYMPTYVCVCVRVCMCVLVYLSIFLSIDR